MNELNNYISGILQQSKKASQELLKLSSEEKNSILTSIADSINKNRNYIISENSKDLDYAREQSLSSSMINRLELNDSVIDSMIEGVLTLSKLNDPVGEIIKSTKREDGLLIEKVRIPIGSIAIVYESRPNVTADASCLCLKSSNAVVLRGGKEAINSNRAIVKCIVEGGVVAGMPKHAVQFVDTVDRKAVEILSQSNDFIDLIIPRGGESLIRKIAEVATVPVLKHYKGLCHIYIDSNADKDMAIKIVENAKCQRPGVCNAVETVLLHKDMSQDVLPRLITILNDNDVEVIGDEHVCKFSTNVVRASESDWSEEYLDLKISIKVVSSPEEAIEHINHYGSHHSDSIVSNDDVVVDMFKRDVDSAVVYHNSSTRFTDGFEFGMGAEMGISTDKLHARGPVGLEELTTYKYLVSGQGHIRK